MAHTLENQFKQVFSEVSDQCMSWRANHLLWRRPANCPRGSDHAPLNVDAAIGTTRFCLILPSPCDTELNMYMLIELPAYAITELVS